MRLGLLAICLASVAGIARSQEPAEAAPVKPPPAGKQLQLRGDRFRGLTYDEMTPEQKALTDRALAGREPSGRSTSFCEARD